jgi:hypothetical protein
MTMLRESGSRSSQIWLLGDSNPKNWANALETPLDPRHPARHSIWTPILDVIQDKIYRQARLRVDTSTIFIRNAIGDPASKPAGNVADWSKMVFDEMEEFCLIINQFKPKFIFTFGAFSYEFTRRVFNEVPKYPYSYWGARKLGNEFRKRLDGFSPKKTNIFPLLHATIARGKFIESHEYFSDQKGANYFEYVAQQVANIFLSHKDNLDIWIR